MPLDPTAAGQAAAAILRTMPSREFVSEAPAIDWGEEASETSGVYTPESIPA